MVRAIAQQSQLTEIHAAQRLMFAQAALGAAGHEVTDPYLKDILARHARGDLSGDEARELSKQHILSS